MDVLEFSFSASRQATLQVNCGCDTLNKGSVAAVTSDLQINLTLSHVCVYLKRK